MTRDRRLEQRLRPGGGPVPTPVPEVGQQTELVAPMAGGPAGETVPLTFGRQERGEGWIPAVPIQILDRHEDPEGPDVDVDLEEITAPTSSTRILTTTPPGDDVVTVDGHRIRVGFVTFANLNSCKFFRDGVTLKSDADSPQYNGASWSVRAKTEENGDGSTHKKWEIILVFAEGVSDLQEISLALTAQGVGYYDLGAGSGEVNCTFTVPLRFNLINHAGLLAADDPWYFEKLTWSLAGYDDAGESHGTLYDDASRYDDNSGAGYTLFYPGASAAADSGSDVKRATNSYYSRRQGSNKNLWSGTPLSRLVYGVHFWFETPDSDSTSPAITDDAGYTVDLEAVLYNTRSDATWKDHRSYALQAVTFGL
jgi:hypothetical protein